MRIGLFLVLLFSGSQAFSAGFTAVCKADGVHGYRHSTDTNGKLMPVEWSDDESFFDDWTFVYDGSDTLTLDGKEIVLLTKGQLIFAVDAATSEIAGSVWSYALNLDINEIVATQVNAFNSYVVGVKARVVSFNCEFMEHKAQ